MKHYPGISVRAAVEKPADVRVTMQITMSVGQWQDIAKALSLEIYEEWPLRAAISDMVRQIEKTLWVESEPNAASD